MQGYILHVRKARGEDCVVTLLTSNKVETLYRFYGARHPVITAGYKIDFEKHADNHRFLPRLRHVLHLGFPWLKSPERLQVWQQFVTLLYEHLKGVEEPGAFYYDMLENAARRWHLQNPKRSAVEAYLALLAHEGRLHPPHDCFVCGRPLEKELTLARAYLPAHPGCVIGSALAVETVNTLFESGSTLYLDDRYVETLWLTLLEGM